VVKLLAYVSDKDLFAEFYRKKLGRRLLNAASASEDAEKGVLTRLKQQCGQQFTSKMEGMVQDMQLAKEKEKNFGDWLRQKEIRLPIEMTVTVLTTGFWPSFRPLELVLPESMMTAVEQYTKYHEEVNNKTRRLTWLLGMGSVNVRATFDKPYDLTVQPSQAAVLSAFNETGKGPLSFGELQNNTRLGDEDLSRVLFSFTMGKHKLLIKSPEGGRINKTDTFMLNESFVDKARRIKIPLPPADDRRKVQEEVDKDRKHAIDAAIVRIMKSRRALSHSSLIMEVVQQLQRMFQPDIKVIKRSIEGLIEREYLERDQENQQMYKYVA
jgi:cullin 1